MPLQTALSRARLFLSNRGIHSDADRIALLQILSGNLSVTLKSWTPNQDFAKHLRDTLLSEFQNRNTQPHPHPMAAIHLPIRCPLCR